jgi:hypothetical protein
MKASQLASLVGREVKTYIQPVFFSPPLKTEDVLF